jgi:Aberrant zinc-finger
MEITQNSADSYVCIICDEICKDKIEYDNHILQHRTVLNKKTAEKRQEYICKECNFTCSKSNDWTRHLATAKHQNRTISNEKSAVQKPLHKCSICYKEYKAKNSLWYHMKKCSPHVQPIENKIIDFDNQPKTLEIITDLLRKNRELHEQVIEMSKEPKIINNNITNNHITNSNNNTTNNQFNLNMFLNEECKNALNIMDFVRSLNLTVEDIEETGRLGYVGGMTRIFVNALKDMDVKMRPIHCTDIKRETVYVKDQDTWEKDNAEKNKLKRALKQVAHKNLQMLPEWQEQNPDYRILDTPENQQFMQISLSSLGAYSEEDSQKQEDKILKNVLKEVVLDKKTS